MRAALWFLALFGVAVAVALFAGNNQSTVTLFWPPYRLDMSLNLVLLVAVGVFLVVWLAMRALDGLMALPREARRWRVQHQERQIQMGLLDAMAHLAAGRFIRARKTAERVLAQEQNLASVEPGALDAAYARRSQRLRIMLHLLAADSAHALQDQTMRDSHVEQALQETKDREVQDMREAVQLTATRWAVQDRDWPLAQQRFDDLPQGAARRTVALRLRFKMARMSNRKLPALEVARLLGKHGAFSAVGTQSLLRSLAMEYMTSTQDPAAIAQCWSRLDKAEQAMPEVALAAARQLLTYGGLAKLALTWVLPIWEQMVAASVRPGSESASASQALYIRLVQVLEQSFASLDDGLDATWLRRIEQAQMQNPRDELLQYLAGVACLRMRLWGKAQQLIAQALPRLQDTTLRRRAWMALADLAEQRGEPEAAAKAWREAAKT